jgi:hypothetical protein
VGASVKIRLIPLDQRLATRSIAEPKCDRRETVSEAEGRRGGTARRGIELPKNVCVLKNAFSRLERDRSPGRSAHAWPTPAARVKSPPLNPSAFQCFSISPFPWPVKSWPVTSPGPQKSPCKIPQPEYTSQSMETNAQFGFASAVATRVRSVAFAPCYATGGPMRFSQVQPSEPFPPTGNCRNINMATISTGRLSLT